MYYNIGLTENWRSKQQLLWQQGYKLCEQRQYTAAAELFRRAATNGYRDAELYLGYLHSHGLGVERNLHEALRWYGNHYKECKWAAVDVEKVESEIKHSNLPDSRASVQFFDSQFGDIRVCFSENITYPQVRFNANGISVTLHSAAPYDYAICAICQSLDHRDNRRSAHDYGRIDENFRLDYDLFQLRILRGASSKYSHTVSGSCYTIITPANVDFDRPHTREYIISYTKQLMTKEAERYIPQRTSELSKQTSLYYSRCQLMNKRWGYYHFRSGVVSLSWHLIKCSAEFTDIVIIHELVHSKVRNHGSYFYKALSRYAGGERAVKVDKEEIGANKSLEI